MLIKTIGAEQASDPLSAMMAPRVYSFSAFQPSSNLQPHGAGSNPPPSFNMWIPPHEASKHSLPATTEGDEMPQESVLNSEFSQGRGLGEAVQPPISPSTVPSVNDSVDNGNQQQVKTIEGITEEDRLPETPQETLYMNPYPSSQGNFIEDF